MNIELNAITYQPNYRDTTEQVRIIQAYKAGAMEMQKEYEEKIKWFPIYEPPKTAELVIVDSDDYLHACVAVAFIENGAWKYANGLALWFTPRRWRRFL